MTQTSSIPIPEPSLGYHVAANRLKGASMIGKLEL